jgi:hypothetical protein
VTDSYALSAISFRDNVGDCVRIVSRYPPGGGRRPILHFRLVHFGLASLCDERHGRTKKSQLTANRPRDGGFSFAYDSAFASARVCVWSCPLIRSIRFPVLPSAQLVGMTGVGGGSLMTPCLSAVRHSPCDRRRNRPALCLCHQDGWHGRARGQPYRGLERRRAARARQCADDGVNARDVCRCSVRRASAVNTLITSVLSVALFATAVVLLLPQKIVSRYGEYLMAVDPKKTRNMTIIMGAHLRCPGIDFFGRRRSHWRHGSDPALSPSSRWPHRRVRYRPRGAADVNCRFGTLDFGLTDLGLLGSLLVGSIPGSSSVAMRHRACRTRPCVTCWQGRSWLSAAGWFFNRLFRGSRPLQSWRPLPVSRGRKIASWHEACSMRDASPHLVRNACVFF